VIAKEERAFLARLRPFAASRGLFPIGTRRNVAQLAGILQAIGGSYAGRILAWSLMRHRSPLNTLITQAKTDDS